MAIEKNASTSKGKPNGKQPTTKSTHVRLKRSGSHGEKGLARYYLGGRLFTRTGIYRVRDPKQLRQMLNTDKFEVIQEEMLDQAKKQAKEPRGTPVSKRIRRRRAQARHVKKHGELDVEEVQFGEDAGDDYEAGELEPFTEDEEEAETVEV